jgi:hypothetical protein
MNPEVIAELCGELTLLRFFPGEQGARTALFLLIGRMCSNEDQVRWLVRRTLALCNEWPGPVVFRQILCSKFKPADGFDPGGTPMFPDGVPSERLEVPTAFALPSGHIVSVDRALDNGLRLLAVAKNLNRRRPTPPPEVPTNPNFKPITQADIDREVAALRDKRARTELGQ